jgi:hypothetical protein
LVFSKSDNSWPDLKWISVDDTLSKGKALKVYQIIYKKIKEIFISLHTKRIKNNKNNNKKIVKKI